MATFQEVRRSMHACTPSACIMTVAPTAASESVVKLVVVGVKFYPAQQIIDALKL